MIQKEYIPVSQHQNQDQQHRAEERCPTMHHLPGGRENRLTNLNHPLVKRFGTVGFRPQGLVFLVGELSKKANLPTPTSIPSANWRLLKLLFLLANDVHDSILFNLQCEFWVVRYFDLFFPISTSRPCFSTFCWEKNDVELRNPPVLTFLKSDLWEKLDDDPRSEGLLKKRFG